MTFKNLLFMWNHVTGTREKNSKKKFIHAYKFQVFFKNKIYIPEDCTECIADNLDESCVWHHSWYPWGSWSPSGCSRCFAWSPRGCCYFVTSSRTQKAGRRIGALWPRRTSQCRWESSASRLRPYRRSGSTSPRTPRSPWTSRARRATRPARRSERLPTWQWETWSPDCKA